MKEKVYLLWTNNHIYEEQTLIGIYKTYEKAIKVLQNIQTEYYADEVELYITEKEIQE